MTGTFNLANVMSQISSGAQKKLSTKKLATGPIPSAAVPTNKAKALLSGVPISVRGRKPKLGGL